MVFWLIGIVLVFALLIGWWMMAGRGAPPVNRPAIDAAPRPPVAAPDPVLVMAEPATMPTRSPAPVAAMPEPASVAVPEPPAQPAGPAAGGDNLLMLKGVGPALDKMLRSLGVDRFDQIAAWTAADVERIDAQLGRFRGRIERDAWIEQARLLANGDTAAFEAKFGKL